METFDIKISIEGLPDELQVQAVEEAEHQTKFHIYNDGDFMGTVWPECMDKGLCWYSSDEISEDTLIKIGEAIEKRER